MDSPRFEDAWQKSGDNQYKCRLCTKEFPNWVSLSKAVAHEDTELHSIRARELDNPPASTSYPTRSRPETSHLASTCPTAPSSRHPPTATSDNTIYPTFQRQPYIAIPGPRLPSDAPDQIYDDFGGEWYRTSAREPPSANANVGSSGCNRASEADDAMKGQHATDIVDKTTRDSQVEYPDHTNMFPSFAGRSATDARADPRYPKFDASDQEMYFPYKGKKYALQGVMSSFPRTVFSENEVDAMNWHAEMCGVTDLPSPHQVKRDNESIMKLAGTGTTLHEGALGHQYAVNSLKDILSHEMANPLVRKHLKFYPEQPDGDVEDASHSEHWRFDAPANVSCPMARSSGRGGQDYFVHEPALVRADSKLHVVMVTRWEMRQGELHARVHYMTVSDGGFWIDAANSACIPLSSFLSCYPELQKIHSRLKLPSPSIIHGVRRHDGSTSGWAEPLPNKWRTKANGKRVYSLPGWYYCDDTSGNVSKKWNKHNSFLFTLAGLPPKHAHLLWNIHFLATSNIAPPLEMLEEIVRVLKELREEGLEVWDCVHGEYVLIVPWVLAILGDNPMHSELASHIGLTGRRFCRVCDVDSHASDEAARLDAFMKCGQPRKQTDTRARLQEQLEHTLRAAPSTAKAAMTETGIKDKYFEHFFEKMQAKCASVKNGDESYDKSELIKLLHELRDTMPDELFSPALGIPDIDLNAQSPVEVLHTILLGFVKYFWRDAVSRQTSEGKETLKQRLSSLDVSDLQLAALRGSTLVQYAGSLTGRDFRVIVQVAQACLHGMIPNEAYEAWGALGKLCSLVFRPRISGDFESYMSNLEGAIDDFLACTALWSTQWFNKPKFHIILHLPAHIRKFGPATLFATEAFESFNGIIRVRSVHSNRHAPSLDIARQFSLLHATRHLLSGGQFPWRASPGEAPIMRTAGPGFLSFAQDRRFQQLAGMIGLFDDSSSKAGNYCILRPGERRSLEGENARRSHAANAATCTWDETTALSTFNIPCPPDQDQASILCCRSALLRNGDAVRLQSTVLISETGGQPWVGIIRELLACAHKRKAFAAIVTPLTVGEMVLPYRLPRVQPSTLRATQLVPFSDVSCTLHTFHNCARHRCSSSQTKPIIQERQPTGRFTWEIRHDTEPEDQILNLAQLRSAFYLDDHRGKMPRYPNQPRCALIERAIIHRKELEAAEAATKKAKKQRGRKKKQDKEACSPQSTSHKRPAPSGDVEAAPNKRPRHERGSQPLPAPSQPSQQLGQPIGQPPCPPPHGPRHHHITTGTAVGAATSAGYWIYASQPRMSQYAAANPSASTTAAAYAYTAYPGYQLYQ